jgi:large subunit ribosomal protein L1
MARLTISSTQRPLATQVRQTLLSSVTQVRYASGKSKKKTASKAGSSKKAEKKKLPKTFKSFDPTEYPQFSLCDAIR